METKTQKPKDTRPLVAWASADGRIRFSRRGSITRLPICPEYARSRHYKKAVRVWSRMSYDKTPLVPGLPECHGDIDALQRFINHVRETILSREEEKPTAHFSLYDFEFAPGEL